MTLTTKQFADECNLSISSIAKYVASGTIAAKDPRTKPMLIDSSQIPLIRARRKPGRPKKLSAQVVANQ